MAITDEKPCSRNRSKKRPGGRLSRRCRSLFLTVLPATVRGRFRPISLHTRRDDRRRESVSLKTVRRLWDDSGNLQDLRLGGKVMAKGDHIWVSRPLGYAPVGYTHHGIDCGDGTVIHFTGEPGRKTDASIARTTLSEFALDSIVNFREYSKQDDSRVVIDRAESKLGSRDYNLVTNNCEHFATWCCTGRTASQQVRMAGSLTTTGAAAATALGTTAGVVGAVGSVAGVSGAGVMSGLATAGGVIGGGAAAGPLALALGPAAVALGAVQVALRSDKSLPKDENDARRDGRVASVAGAATATAGGMAAVAGMGAVAGTSAAGLTSGLAAIGGLVGGGMVAGTVAVAAAPAVLAGVVGFGAYVMSRKFRGVKPKKVTPPPAGLEGPPETPQIEP